MDENIKNETSFDREDFANVNYDEEVIEEKGKKFSFAKIGIAACAFIVALIVAISLMLPVKTDKGQNNGNNRQMSSLSGDTLYYASLTDGKLMKMDLKKGVEETLTEGQVAYVTCEGRNVYYYDMENTKYIKRSAKGSEEVIYEGVTYAPQIYGKYVYFIEITSSYGGIIKRVNKAGGEAENVLNAHVSEFHVVDNMIYYYDKNDAKIYEISLNKAIKASKGDEILTSDEIGAKALAENIYAYNLNIAKGNIYFLDYIENNAVKVLSIKSGEVKDFNHGMVGTDLNVMGDYLYYVDYYDGHMYRMNLDGKDIRDITGAVYEKVAGLAIEGDRIMYYGIVKVLSQNLEEAYYNMVISVATNEGKVLKEIPQGTIQ